MTEAQNSKTTEEIRAAVLRRRNVHEELKARGDDLSLLAASVIEELRAKTAIEIGWTFEPTKERVRLFAPDHRSLAITAEHPDVLRIYAAVQEGKTPMKDFVEVGDDD